VTGTKKNKEIKNKSQERALGTTSHWGGKGLGRSNMNPVTIKFPLRLGEVRMGKWKSAREKGPFGVGEATSRADRCNPPNQSAKGGPPQIHQKKLGGKKRRKECRPVYLLKNKHS